MSLTAELRNSIEQVYLFDPTKKELRLLGIPQNYQVEKIDENIKNLLDDEEFRNDTLRLMAGSFNLFSTLDLDNYADIEKFFEEKYRDKLEKLNRLYRLLENLPAKEYKDYWLSKYYRLLDIFVKGKEEFLKTIEQREGVNTIMEFYYKVFTGLLTQLLEDVKHYKTEERLKAKDDVRLRGLVSKINVLTFVLSYPIMAYLQRENVDYEILTYLISVFAKPSALEDKYSLLIGEAIFG